MKLKKIFYGRALYTEKDKIWVAKGMTFYAINFQGERVTKRYFIGNKIQKILSLNRLIRQLLREGIHHLLPLKNGDIFVTTKKKAYTIDKEGNIKNIFEGYKGNKPGHQGVCITPKGDIFFGEYTLNMKRENDTILYRSTDNGLSFQPILTLEKTRVRHIHFVKYDPYEKCLWLGTGDKDDENLLMRSDDNGDSWTVIGKGTQDWRAIGVCFEKDYLIWGTDAGSVPDKNHIIRMNRKSKEIEILLDVEGPCHGCGSFKDGRIYISTGIEGGQNEKDEYARMMQIENKKVKMLFKKKKDMFPLILQYGVMRFPLGTENTNKVIFSCYALKGDGEVVYCEE